MELKTVSISDRQQLNARVAEIYASSHDPLADSGKLLSQLSGGAAVVARQTKARTLPQPRPPPPARTSSSRCSCSRMAPSRTGS